MNRDWLLFHLREARDELSRTVNEIEQDPEFDEGQLRIALAHLYHHANTAWNARNKSKQMIEKQTDEEWQDWGRFPENFELMKVRDD